MSPRLRPPALAAAALLLLAAQAPTALAQQNRPADPSSPTLPGSQDGSRADDPDAVREDNGGESLSDELSRSDGVIEPETDIDPGMSRPAPDTGPQSTPVIPPLGSPGGDRSIEPK